MHAYFLSVNIHICAEFKFNCKLILINHYSFNHSLTKYSSHSSICSTRNCFISAIRYFSSSRPILHHRILFYFTQTIYLISEIIVILLGIDSFQKFLFQFLQPGIDALHRAFIFQSEHHHNIILQDCEHIIFTNECLVNDHYHHILQFRFLYGWCIKTSRSMFSPAHTT